MSENGALPTAGVCLHEYSFWNIAPLCVLVNSKCDDYVMWSDFSAGPFLYLAVEIAARCQKIERRQCL